MNKFNKTSVSSYHVAINIPINSGYAMTRQNRLFDDLRGRTIRILTGRPSINGSTTDVDSMLLHMVFTFTGLKYQIITPTARDADDNGILNRATGEWSGALGYLQRGEADMALELFSMSDERLFDFDFLPAVKQDQYGFHISDDVVNDEGGRGNSIQSRITVGNTFGSLHRIFVPFLYQAWLGILLTFGVVVGQIMLFECLFAWYRAQRHAKRMRCVVRDTWRHINNDNDDEEKAYRKSDDDNFIRPAQDNKTALERMILRAFRAAETFVISIDQLLRPLMNQSPTLLPATSASQIIILTWCLCSVLVTALYAANLTTIFGAASPLKTPFNNISSLYQSGYLILLTPASSSEQLLNNLIGDLKGTADGAMLAEVVRESRPYWSRKQKQDYNPQLRSLPAPPSAQPAAVVVNATTTQAVPTTIPYNPNNRFALLSATQARDGLQSPRCDLRTLPFYFPLHANATSLVHVPLRSLSYAMHKGSNFTAPLTRTFGLMESLGVFKMLQTMEWKANALKRSLKNSEIYRCDDFRRRQHAEQRGWHTLTLRGLLPTFTLLLASHALSATIFAIERLAQRFRQRQLKRQPRTDSMSRNADTVERNHDDKNFMSSATEISVSRKRSISLHVS